MTKTCAICGQVVAPKGPPPLPKWALLSWTPSFGNHWLSAIVGSEQVADREISDPLPNYHYVKVRLFADYDDARHALSVDAGEAQAKEEGR